MSLTIARSKINEMKREYCDTVGGIILSEYDVFLMDHVDEPLDIIEDAEPIEDTEARQRKEYEMKLREELLCR